MVDELTGLLSRKAFFEKLHETHEGKNKIILLLDIDNFRVINLSYGYAVGDLILKNTGLYIKRGLSKYFSEFFIARTGSNTFGVVILDEVPLVRIEEAFHKYLKKVSFKKGKEVISITLSGGVSSGKQNVEDLVAKAEAALFSAKESGKNTLIVNQSSKFADVMKVQEFRRKLIQAIEEGGVTPFFQPIVSLRTGEIFAYEVLARIFYKDEVLRGDYVFAVADSFSLTPEIDKQIFLKAIEFASDDYRLFFNLSMKYFVKELNFIFQTMKKRPYHCKNIVLEITESQRIFNEGIAKSFFQMFREFNIGIAVDDFGAGYSNFMYLKKFPADVLKIDGGFIKNAKNDIKDLTIVKSIVDVGRAFRLRTLAEFIEDEETYRIMKEIGVSLGQGWFIGKPSPEPQKVKIKLS